MMKLLFFTTFLCLIGCQQKASESPSLVSPQSDISQSMVRVNSTLQSWNIAQPWEKNPPRQRRSLAAVVDQNQVITTAEMVADATLIELESTDGSKRARAAVACVDYEANLALLKLDDPKADADFFTEKTALTIAPNPALGDSLDVIQVEDNGSSLITSGQILSADVRSTFLPGQNFLTFRVKASMQSSASSYSLPVVKNGQLVGILSSYDSKDQISDVIATPLIARFLMEAKKSNYQGFPNLGVNIQATDDPHFRKFLHLPEEDGGIFVSKVRKGSAADLAKIQPRDVIVAIDDCPIDRRGYYQDPMYGRLPWMQLVRGTRSAGDVITLHIWREQKKLSLPVTLTRQEEDTRLVPNYQFGKAPNFLIKGGMIFQEITRPLLEAYGDEWESRAPLSYLHVLSEPETYQEKHERMICLSGVIPTQATVGYESLRHLIVSQINGKPIRNMRELIAALNNPPLGQRSHRIEFMDESIAIYLDDAISDQIDAQLLQRGLPQLHRAD
jgi:S1-C subfamily serine protease